MRKIESFPWWTELLNLKDQYSLRELADRFDVTPGAITAAFKRTGTTRKAAPPGPRNRRAPVSQDRLPPEPGEAPRKRGRPPRRVVAEPPPEAGGAEGEARPGSKDVRIVKFRDLLGNVPDAEVARKAGVSVRTVASFRARNGIRGYAGPRRRGADRQPRKSRIDDFADVVGTVPDRVVAEKAGVSINAVRNWRVKRGVVARGRKGGDEASTTPVAVAAGLPVGSGAWRVTIGTGAATVVRVVLAPSLSSAVAQAEAAGLRPLLGVEWIGELLG